MKEGVLAHYAWQACRRIKTFILYLEVFSMKKTFKLFSFFLACIFCLAAMTSSVFAVDNHSVSTRSMAACPDHPNAGCGTAWGQTPSGTLIHYYTCNTCGFRFAADECIFSGYGDCTAYSYCILCDRPNPIQYTDHIWGEWRCSEYVSHHWRMCTRENCFEEQRGDHDHEGDELNMVDPNTGAIIPGKQNVSCSVCGYRWND